MRRAVSVALGVVCVAASSVVCAKTPGDVRTERQAYLASVLKNDRIESVQKDRLTCASGTQSTKIAHMRSLGLIGMPDAADYCITVLARLAFESKLPPIRDPQTSATTPAVALDTGFAAGYTSRNLPLASLPSIMMLRPIAERCLNRSEPNIRLCYSAGYAFGARIAQGETIQVR